MAYGFVYIGHRILYHGCCARVLVKVSEWFVWGLPNSIADSLFMLIQDRKPEPRPKPCTDIPKKIPSPLGFRV